MLSQVSRPCRRVVPLSLYSVGDPLHDLLRRYKDGASAVARRHHQALVGALAARFLWEHRSCLLAGSARPWDALTTVPSTSGRGSRAGRRPHPLVEALRMVPYLAARHRELLAWTGLALGHNRASDGAFEVTAAVGGARILLLDDTYTSGARAQSAASALALAGAEVLAVVVVGRVVDTPAGGPQAGRPGRHGEGSFRFGRCCLEADIGRQGVGAARLGAGEAGAADPHLLVRPEEGEPDQHVLGLAPAQGEGHAVAGGGGLRHRAPPGGQ